MSTTEVRQYVVSWEKLLRQYGEIVGTEPKAKEVWAYDAKDAISQVGEPLGGFKLNGYPRLISVGPISAVNRNV